MQYVFATIDKAEAAGFITRYHRANDKYVLLSGKEVMDNRALSGTLEERAKALGGEAMQRVATYDALNKRKKYKMK